VAAGSVIAADLVRRYWLRLFLFAGVESRVVHLFFPVAFSTSVILVLIVVRMLDYPFEGALTLSNSDFIKTIAHVSALVGGT
jgi:hypothetical protein